MEETLEKIPWRIWNRNGILKDEVQLATEWSVRKGHSLYKDRRLSRYTLINSESILYVLSSCINLQPILKAFKQGNWVDFISFIRFISGSVALGKPFNFSEVWFPDL